MLVQSLRRCYNATSPVSSTLWRHLARAMQSESSRPDHLERTAGHTRSVNESKAYVKSITNLSSTVKGVTLKVDDTSLHFHPGQWVDLMIPGLSKVGGFSMSSAPHRLESHQELDLAVKFSMHPPAHWVHTQCCVGCEVTLCVGGDFFYRPRHGAKPHSLLLLAGGVGINPVYSILQHAAHLRHHFNLPVTVSMLYSARTQEELIFRDKIQEIADRNKESIGCKFFVTQETGGTSNDSVKFSRIDKAALEEQLKLLQTGGTPVTSYICGPSPMLDDMEGYLLELGLGKHRIIYEKWW